MTFEEKIQRLEDLPRTSLISVEEEAVYKKPNEELESVDINLLLSTANAILASSNANREPLARIQSGLRNLRMIEVAPSDDIW